jgi:hypothetical protein
MRGDGNTLYLVQQQPRVRARARVLSRGVACCLWLLSSDTQ